MSRLHSPWILTLLFAVASPVAAQEDSSAGPISRFFQRDRQPAAHSHHHHHHAPAQPAAAVAPAYEPVYLQAEAVAPPADEASAQPAAVQYVVAEPTPAPTAAPAPFAFQGGGDPYGFTNVLNRIRAAAGLHPLSYDPSLSSWAQQNNAEQCRLGLGHHVNPTGTQNCAYNYSDANAAASGWMNSPGHRENMLSPTATSFGIAFGPGPYWTMNAR